MFLLAPFKREAYMYISVRIKFILCILFACLWASFSYIVAKPWIESLSLDIPKTVAYSIIFGIAIIPGFMNAFLVSSLLVDKRPKYKKKLTFEDGAPAISILIAAYNEEDSIMSTLQSLEKQDYPGEIQVIVVNDGSTDKTKKILDICGYDWLKTVHLDKNYGKSHALNTALSIAEHDLVVTLDADSYLYHDALSHLTLRFLNDPDNTAAVAGAVLVRNSRKNLITKMQEWDYFHGIASIKRLQSLFQGTLVAQGAFSIYKKEILQEIGGWKEVVGEDIVLTWDILAKGYRVGFAEDACSFTNAPDNLLQFLRQRQRWSRGLIEAFKHDWRLLFKPKYITFMIWWNLLFPFMDFIYTFVFIPGIILALFGKFYIVGPMTIAVLPLALIINYIMYTKQHQMFMKEGLKVRRNPVGFIFYTLTYGILLQPACVLGYVKELTNTSKQWGTK